MKPFFSIIIPVYNVAPYLRECLDSVLAQTFADWEAICVDDGSTDNSGRILDEYAARDPRFRVIHQPNAGVSAARNKGLDEANSEWLTFVDADDVVPHDAYGRYAKLIRDHDYDAYFMQLPKAFTDKPLQVCEGDGRIIYATTPATSSRAICGADLLLQKFRLLGYPFIRLLKRSLFGNMRFPVGIAMMEDNISLYDNLAIKARFAVVNLITYAYRERSGSASRVYPVGRVLQIFEIYEKIYGIVRNKLGMTNEEATAYLLQNKSPMQYYFREGLYNENMGNLRKIAKIALFLHSSCGNELLDSFMHLRCLIINKYGSTLGFELIGVVEYIYCALKHRYNMIVSSIRKKDVK